MMKETIDDAKKNIKPEIIETKQVEKKPDFKKDQIQKNTDKKLN